VSKLASLLATTVEYLFQLLETKDPGVDAAVRAGALETYVRRMYRAHRVQNVTVDETDGKLTATWTFRFSDIEEADSVARRGILAVVPSLEGMLSSHAALDPHTLTIRLRLPRPHVD
jgi:hypothetical protein